jgi:DNA-directed RNA polymerase specialized sigma24 family protein
MLQPAYEQLLAMARRQCRGTGEPDELLHEALIEALRVGRADFADPLNRRWLAGVIRNKARMAARTGHRRHRRETAWQALRTEPQTAEANPTGELLANLPPSLKSVAALALSGHTRREIAYLLKLEDTALRQRISELRRRLTAAGIAMPEGLPGLGLELAYGRIRDALLPALLRERGVFASHDPDGHLFIIRRSQIDGARQLGASGSKKGAQP